MLLDMSGMKSADNERSQPINLHYFWMTDQIKMGNVNVEYQQTGERKPDFFTKPLVGAAEFFQFRKAILDEG